MVQERAEASGNGYPSPIHPDKPSTDQSYNKALEYLLGEVARGRVNLMVASHNRPSVELAVEKYVRVCVCVCMCVYIYICMYICMYVHMYLCKVCMYIHVCSLSEG